MNQKASLAHHQPVHCPDLSRHMVKIVSPAGPTSRRCEQVSKCAVYMCRLTNTLELLGITVCSRTLWHLKKDFFPPALVAESHLTRI